MTIEAPDNPVVDDALSRISRLATLPEIVARIMDLVDDPDASAADLESLVSGDPVLSTRVLKVVNSSFYGMPASVTSIHQAIVVLGMDALRNIVLAASLTKMFQGRGGQTDFDPKGIWQHSMAVGAAAKLVADQVGNNRNEFFIMGLLHDVGTLIQFQTMRTQFRDFLAATAADDTANYQQAEKSIIGATHDEFGLALCIKWNFPASIQAAVGFHHNPDKLDGELKQIAQIVALADSLATETGEGYCCVAEAAAINELAARLGLSAEGLAETRSALPELIKNAEKLVAA